MGIVTIAEHRAEEESLDLPTGFRFHPRDEEIITYYLTPKVLNHSFCARAMGEVDLNKCEPWDLPRKAKMGEKEWYFFCQKDKKYPTGMRTNRATEAGYWKATGKDKEIYRGRGVLVGMKKTLVFYEGRAPRGGKTNWVMHEYRLQGKLPFSNSNPSSSKDEWVVCKVFHKSFGTNRSPMDGSDPRTSTFDSTTLHHPVINQLYYDPTMWAGTTRAAELNASSFTKLVALENPQQLRAHLIRSGDPCPSLRFYTQAPAESADFCDPDMDGTTHRTLANWPSAMGSSTASHYDVVDILLSCNELDCSILTCF